MKNNPKKEGVSKSLPKDVGTWQHHRRYRASTCFANDLSHYNFRIPQGRQTLFVFYRAVHPPSMERHAPLNGAELGPHKWSTSAPMSSGRTNCKAQEGKRGSNRVANLQRDEYCSWRNDSSNTTSNKWCIWFTGHCKIEADYQSESL